jgi:hypothetical protein
VARRRRVEIVRRTLLKQKWYARFHADNDLVLAHTEHYANLGDLQAMLNEYFPDWPVAPGYATRGRG